MEGQVNFTDRMIAQHLSLGGWFFHTTYLLVVVFVIAWVIFVEWSTGLVIAVSFITFLDVVALPFIVWINTKLNPRRTMRFNIAMQDNGLVWKSEFDEKLVKWSEISKWRMGFRTFLLFVGQNKFEIIPFHFFSSQTEALKFGKVLESKYGKSA